MLKTIKFLFIFVSLILPLKASASISAPEKLKTAKDLACEFPVGQTADWKNGELELKKSPKGLEVSIHFNSINLDSNTAQMMGNNGTSHVMARLTPRGLTFLEYTSTGNMIYTTVFPSYISQAQLNKFNVEKDANNTFIAVMSRHLMILDPLPSQYQGYCTVLE